MRKHIFLFVIKIKFYNVLPIFHSTPLIILINKTLTNVRFISLPYCISSIIQCLNFRVYFRKLKFLSKLHANLITQNISLMISYWDHFIDKDYFASCFTRIPDVFIVSSVTDNISLLYKFCYFAIKKDFLQWKYVLQI